MLKNDEIGVIRELADELNFARQFLTDEDDNNYQKIKDLTNKIEELEKKLDETKIQLDKEFFESIKKELEGRRQEIIEIFDKDIKLFQIAAKDFENNKNYLINIIDEIKQENKALRKEIRIFNKAHLFFTIFIFAAAAAVGYFFGCHHHF